MNFRRTRGSISACCLVAFGLLTAAVTFAGAATASPAPTASSADSAALVSSSEETAGPKRAASITSVKVKSKRVKHGSKVKVRGVVDKASKRVGVYFRPSDSKRWRKLKGVSANARGGYRTKVTARRNGQLKAISSRGASSQPKKLRVRSRISVKPVRRFTRVGGRVLIRGVVRPAGKRRIKLAVSGGEVLRTRTKANGGFALSWKPRRTGSVRIRAFAAGNGVAASDASRRIRVTGLRQTYASYFGPGLYGGPMACGGRLYPGTRGVAHKSLPCGTKVTLRYRGRTVTTRVVDRGPYVGGREFDLTAATRNDLGFGDLGSLWTDR